MKAERRQEDELHRRRKAEREGDEYKSPEERRAQRERRRELKRRVQFEREYYEYMRDPLAYLADGYASPSYDIDTDEITTAVWVPYKGSRGGKGWQNLRTGDIKYDLENPGANAPLDEPQDSEEARRQPAEDSDTIESPPETESSPSPDRSQWGADVRDVKAADS